MSTRSIHFDMAVDGSALRELHKALNFFYGAVEIGTAEPDGFTVSVDGSLSEDELRGAVRHFLRGHRPIAATVVAEYPGRPDSAWRPPVDDRVEIVPGAYLHGPDWASAMEVTRVAVRENFGAQFAAPLLTGSTFVHREVLIKAGYYRKFPNLVNAVSRIRPNYWDGVSVAQLRPGQTDALASFYVPSELVLNPVTCYQVYARGRELIERYDTTLFAIEGPVFRHESHNHDTTRLSEFTMYELVRLGRQEEVRVEFDRFLDAFEKFFGDLGLPFRIATASDAFFGDEPALTQRAQLTSGAKYEVCVPIGDRELSVGSVNLHGGVFAEAFDLSTAREIDASCCAGIGIDRLVYALKSYGISLDRQVGAAQ